MIKADEKYSTQMILMEDLCAEDIPSVFTLMWLFTKRRQKKP
jgi:hypothetical protein